MRRLKVFGLLLAFMMLFTVSAFNVPATQASNTGNIPSLSVWQSYSVNPNSNNMSKWPVTATRFETATDSQGYPLIYDDGTSNHTLCIGGSFPCTDENDTYSYFNVGIYTPSGTRLWTDPLDVVPGDIYEPPSTALTANGQTDPEMGDDYDGFALPNPYSSSSSLDVAPDYWAIGGGPYSDSIEKGYNYHSIGYVLPAAASRGIYYVVVTCGLREPGGYDDSLQSTLSGTSHIVAKVPFDYEYPPVSIVDNNFNVGEVGHPYPSETYTASGGNGGHYTWSDNGELASLGLAIGGSSGTISGTPTTAYTTVHGYNETIYAKDSNSDQGSLNHTLNVYPALSITTGALPSGKVSAYSTTMAATGGFGPTYGSTYTWSATGLPSTLTIGSSSGTISGTPTTAGTSSVKVTVTDGLNYTASKTYNLTVGANATYTVTYNGNGATSGSVPSDTSTYQTAAQVTVLGNNGSLAITGFAFGGWNTAANGSGTTTYQAGDTFNMGSASVTLYAVWTATFSIYTVTYDGNGATSGSVPTDANTYQKGAPVTVLDNDGSLAMAGFAFGGWNTAANGSGTTTYQAGDTFNMGSANVTLYAVWMTTLSLTATGTELPPCLVNSLYDSGDIIQNQYVTVSGGMPNYSWSSPDLQNIPGKLTMDPTTGAITGYATTVGPYIVTVTVTDSSSPLQSQSVQLPIYVYAPNLL